MPPVLWRHLVHLSYLDDRGRRMRSSRPACLKNHGKNRKRKKEKKSGWKREGERRAWWHSLVVPTLGRLKQKGQHVFEVTLGYIHTNKRFEWPPGLLVHANS